MRHLQQLLFPDPRPLVDQLGRAFFRDLPNLPGVYLMHDAAQTVLYIGKAKNLRRRLGSYRVANPDRLPRRQLRLLRSVAGIEIEICLDESAALAREAALLRTLQPQFNRAGTWPATPRHLAFKHRETSVYITVLQTPPADWLLLGPPGYRAVAIHAALARLLWLVARPDAGLVAMPAGWSHGLCGREVALDCGKHAQQITNLLISLGHDGFPRAMDRLRNLIPNHLTRFDQAWSEQDIEFLATAWKRPASDRNPSRGPSNTSGKQSVGDLRHPPWP